jgi:hypothetical protein
MGLKERRSAGIVFVVRFWRDGEDKENESVNHELCVLSILTTLIGALEGILVCRHSAQCSKQRSLGVDQIVAAMSNSSSLALKK